VIPAGPVPREPLPLHLPPDEAAIWNQVVQGLPPHWFPGASFVLLEIYCASVVSMRTSRAVMAAEVEGTKIHQQASRLYRAEAATVLRLAKTLRLGPRHDRTRVRAVPQGPRPWDLYGSREEPRSSLGFEQEMKEVLAQAKRPEPDDESGGPPAA
jgi:hypothetical protein